MCEFYVSNARYSLTLQLRSVVVQAHRNVNAERLLFGNDNIGIYAREHGKEIDKMDSEARCTTCIFVISIFLTEGLGVTFFATGLGCVLEKFLARKSSSSIFFFSEKLVVCHRSRESCHGINVYDFCF